MATRTGSPDFAKIMDTLKEYSLLLLSDSRLPSVTTIIAGEVVRGSWWAHQAGRRIFQIATLLEANENVLAVKLVSSKVTFLSRDLWPQVIAIGRAREPWQMKLLGSDELHLLKLIDRFGSLTVGDTRILDSGLSIGEARAAARLLESSLLIYSTSEHTTGGRHERSLSTWDVWEKYKTGALLRQLPTPADARRQLECLVEHLNATSGAKGWLPWQKV